MLFHIALTGLILKKIGKKFYLLKISGHARNEITFAYQAVLLDLFKSYLNIYWTDT